MEDVNKKSFAESVRIKEGKSFNLGKTNGGAPNDFNKNNGRRRDMKYESKRSK